MKNALTGKTAQLFLLALLMGIFLFWVTQREYVYKGSSYYPFPQAYAFQLTDQNGERFDLADNLNKVVLLFFGYTNCPDACPITLAVYGSIHEKLGDKADQVVLVFITEDPQRDTQERLRDYLSAFDTSIIGLTGSLEELQPVWDAYHVAREMMLDTESSNDVNIDENYMVAHTSRIFVIDGTGHLRLTFPYGMEVDDMLHDILYLTKGL